MDGSVLVVEDDAATRKLLAANLEHAGYRVSCARNVVEARAVSVETRLDVVLLDRMVNGYPALNYARQLRSDRRTAGTGIIVLGTNAPHEQDAITALESGADDYMVRPLKVHELLARVKAVVRRRAPQLDDEPVEVAGLRFDPAARRVTAGEREVELCPIEYRLLRFFMTHPGRILGRSRLLDEVWGEQVSVEERTVDLHVRRLRQALEPSGHSALIETVRGLGYRFRTEPEPAPMPRRPAAERPVPTQWGAFAAAQ